MMKGYGYKYDRTRPLGLTVDDVDVTDCAWALRVQTQLDNIFFPHSEELESCLIRSAQEIDWIVRLLELIVGEKDSQCLWNEAIPDENIVPLVLPGNDPISPSGSTSAAESTEHVGDEILA